MQKMLRSLTIAATILGAPTAQAGVNLIFSADLTYTLDDPDPFTDPEIRYQGPAKFTLSADNWQSAFMIDTSNYSVYDSVYACNSINSWTGNGCLNAVYSGNTVNFYAPEYGGFYQNLSLSLSFDRDISADPSLIYSAELTGGEFYWSYGHHNGTASLTGPITWLSVPEPSTWAMALIGFGAIGAVMRRRHSPLQMA